MRIFVTGGTGYIGRRVLRELVEAGHDVTSLTRSPEKASAGASDLSVTFVGGDLLEPDSWAAPAAAADAVVHMGFDYGSPVEADRVALDALLRATGGRSAKLIYTSGMWVVGDTGGREYGDDAPTDEPADVVTWRVPHEERALAAGGGDRIAAVVRPGTVYGRGGGFTARMFSTAAKDGAAEHVGSGENHWSNIHVDDLARLYLAVVERGGSGVFNASDGAPERVKDIAAAASRAVGADGATRAVPVEEAREKIGPVADALALDQHLHSPAARVLGWKPRHPSFTAAAGIACDEWKASRES